MNLRCVFTSTGLPLKNADSATAHSSTLVWGNMARQGHIRDSTNAQMFRAVVSAYWVAGDKAVILHLATNRVNDIPTLMRRSQPFPTREYTRMDSFTTEAIAAEGAFRAEMIGWGTIAEIFRMELSFDRDGLQAVCAQLEASGILLPFDMSRVTPSEAHHLDQVSSDPASLRALWSSSRNDASSPSNSPAEYLSPSRELFTKDPARKRPADIPLNFRARERSRFVP